MKPLNNLLGFSLFSVGGGACLATVIASFIFNSPLWLSRAFELMLGVASGQISPVTGGMSPLGLACLVATSIFSVAVVLWLLQTIVRGAQEGIGPWRTPLALDDSHVPVWAGRPDSRSHSRNNTPR
jgi:hypothetical protein